MSEKIPRLDKDYVGRYTTGFVVWVRKYGDYWAWHVEAPGFEASGDAKEFDGATAAMISSIRHVPDPDQAPALDPALADMPMGTYYAQHLKRYVGPTDPEWSRDAYEAITGHPLELGWKQVSDLYEARFDVSGKYPCIHLRRVDDKSHVGILSSLELANIIALMPCEKKS